MIKLIDKKQHKDVVKPINKMKPLEVCVIIEGVDKGTVVLRTADSKNFEVMDLSNSGIDEFWNHSCDISVRELRKGETYTLKLS